MARRLAPSLSRADGEPDVSALARQPAAALPAGADGNFSDCALGNADRRRAVVGDAIDHKLSARGPYAGRHSGNPWRRYIDVFRLARGRSIAAKLIGAHLRLPSFALLGELGVPANRDPGRARQQRRRRQVCPVFGPGRRGAVLHGAETPH
jgi:hypothetical protein